MNMKIQWNNKTLIKSIDYGYSKPCEVAYSDQEVSDVIFGGTEDEKEAARREWRTRFAKDEISAPLVSPPTAHKPWARTAHAEAWDNN